MKITAINTCVLTIRIPDRPGHGMVLQRGAIRKYRSENF
jgi:hypothetical protein